MPVEILPHHQPKASLQARCRLICSSSALSFLQLSEMGTVSEKQATQKKATLPQERSVMQNKIIA